jgi:hypothetical protein
MSLLFIGHPKETDLALFAGGELGPLARWRIERHLQQCDGCQDAVADFFHLQSEVTELAETPPVDWKALAHNIAVRVRVEAPAAEEKAPGWLAHPRIWQVGLATATLLCTIVVVRQLPMISESGKEAASPAVADTRVDQKAVVPEADVASAIPPQESAAAPPAVNSPIAGSQFAQSADEFSSRDSRTRESNETAAAEPSESAPSALRNRRDEGFRLESASERRALPDIEAERPPAAERVAVQAANLAVAPPPPAAPVPAPQTEADTAAFQDRAVGSTSGPGAAAGAAFRQTAEAGEDRKTERAELAQASRAAAPAQRLLARRAGLEKKTDADSVWNTERGFTVLPAALQDPAVDVGVAADGWISIRAVDANTGTITITDVYVP